MVVILIMLSIGAFYIYSAAFKLRRDEKKAVANLTPFEKDAIAFKNFNIGNVDGLRLKDGTYRFYYDDGLDILSATSDNAKKFDEDDGVRITGTSPAIIETTDNKFRLYYIDRDASAVKSAISSDGLKFKLEKGIRFGRGPKGAFDNQEILHIDVISLADSKYRIYYDGIYNSAAEKDENANFKWQILSATSSDGLNFKKDKGVRIIIDKRFEEYSTDDLEANVPANPHVAYDDGTYTLYFDMIVKSLNSSGIYQAISTDGLKFKVLKNPILARYPKYKEGEGLDEFGLLGMPQEPFVIKTDSGERLFYWLTREGIYSAFRLSR